jgi:uncharacterized protein YjbI with pentapeptide repeats
MAHGLAMANSEHLVVVRLGPTAIRHWAAVHPRQYLDLEGADLRGVDLSGADLTMLFLRRADLRCARLSDARLDCVNLRGARLDHARLDGASLRHADLGPRVNLSVSDEESFVPTTLAFTDISEAVLEGAILDHVDLSSAVVTGTLVVGAHISSEQCSVLEAGGAIMAAVQPAPLSA